jgi:hypothetical protein
MTGFTRPRRKLKRVVIAAAIPTALALVVAVPRSWWPAAPGQLFFVHVKSFVPQRVTPAPKIVIPQARARQQRRHRRIIVAAGGAAAAARAADGSGSPPRHRRDHDGQGGPPPPIPRAEELPGLAALDKGGTASISGLSCPAAGNCTMDGYFATPQTPGTPSSGGPFVTSEVRGRWSKAEEVPGLLALDPSGRATISPVSCPSAGTCLAVGYYNLPGGPLAGFQVTEHDGVWGEAQQIPGLPVSGQVGPNSLLLSCASVGNCAVGGHYQDASFNNQAFVASETNGEWSNAQPVPGLAGLGSGKSSAVTAITCVSAGNCTASGTYGIQIDFQGGFAVSETGGVWGGAQSIPGSTPAGGLFVFTVDAISCASAGNCGLAGDYIPWNATNKDIPFVASQVNGTWGTAEPVPGLAAHIQLNQTATTGALSCPAPGDCTAVGYYTPAGPHHSPGGVHRLPDWWHLAQRTANPRR